MAPGETTSPEQPILRARARGELPCDEAFELLYELYAPVVRGWLLASVRGAEVDDLFQDIWTVFYRRWLQWRFLPEMEEGDARPVISFLYRTFSFVLEAHRRTSRTFEQIESVEVSDRSGEAKVLLKRLELTRCLDLAQRICPPEELDVLLAKLAEVPAREIARTFSVTESVVDHRFRKAIARLQRWLKPLERAERRKNNG